MLILRDSTFGEILKQIEDKNIELQRLENKLDIMKSKEDDRSQIDELKQEIKELEKKYNHEINKKNGETISMHHKKEKQLLANFDENRKLYQNQLQSLQHELKIQEQHTKEIYQIFEEKYYYSLTFLKTIYEKKISYMENTIQIIHKLSKYAQESLIDIKQLNQQVEQVEKELNIIKNDFEQAKKEYYNNEGEMKQLKESFNIKYGQYQEAKKHDKKRALTILRKMLKIDKEYNNKSIKEIELKKLLEIMKEKVIFVETAKEDIKNKRFDSICELDKQLFVQEYLTNNQDKSINVENNELKILRLNGERK